MNALTLSLLLIVTHSILVCSKEHVFEKEILVSIDAVCEEEDSQERYTLSYSLDTDESESEDEYLLSKKKYLEEQLIESIDKVSIKDDGQKQLSSVSSKIPDESNESKTKEQLLPSKINEKERKKLENHLLKKMNSSVRKRFEELAGVDSDEIKNLDQFSPTKMSQEMREKFENHFFAHMIDSGYQTLDEYFLAKMNSDEIRELNQQLLNDMSSEGREKLERDPLLKMDHVKRNELCMAAKEKASLRDDTGLDSYVHLYKIRKDKLEDMDELKMETVVAIRCASVPVVYLRLGESDDQIKIMFSYSFSVEAIGSVDHAIVSDPEMKANFEKNHFHTFAQEELRTICNITTKYIPLENISLKDENIDKPRVFEIDYPRKFQKPNIRDLIIKCPLDPISVYLRYSPVNEVKIMIVKDQLQRLLGLSLETEETEEISEDGASPKSTITEETDERDSRTTNLNAASS